MYLIACTHPWQTLQSKLFSMWINLSLVPVLCSFKHPLFVICGRVALMIPWPLLTFGPMFWPLRRISLFPSAVRAVFVLAMPGLFIFITPFPLVFFIIAVLIFFVGFFGFKFFVRFIVTCLLIFALMRFDLALTWQLYHYNDNVYYKRPLKRKINWILTAIIAGLSELLFYF